MIADLHAHYAMHLVDEGASVWKLLGPARGRGSLRDRARALLVGLASRFGNYRSLFSGPRVTLSSLREGDVRVVLSVLYSFFDELELDEPYPAQPKRAYRDTLIGQLELVEHDLAEKHGSTAVVVRTPEQLARALEGDRVAFVHCVEGGFHLGSTPAEVDEAVRTLAERGVAYITLAHLVWRHVATNTNALPFLSERDYRRWFPQPENEGLSDLGRTAVRAMLSEGVLIDLSHMSGRSLSDTLDLLDEVDPGKTQPVIASHACFRFGSQEYGVDEPTLRRVAERGGVVGLILAQHQLRDGVSNTGGGLDGSFEVICRHVDRISEITGSDEHAGIGSDFDGFIKPTMAGLESMSDLAKLEERLRGRYGEEKAALICSGNVLRVLEAGWGRKLA